MIKHKKRTPLISAISASSGIPIDMLSSLPLIKMLSNREIYIEDAGRIIRYDKECVALMQRRHVVEIKGENLNLRSLADGNISVDGYIESVSFADGERKET
jgi:sporulation protein YqfC